MIKDNFIKSIGRLKKTFHLCFIYIIPILSFMHFSIIIVAILITILDIGFSDKHINFFQNRAFMEYSHTPTFDYIHQNCFHRIRHQKLVVESI